MIKFSNATIRNTRCYFLSIGKVRLTISYETVIAARLPTGAIRRANSWGRTTGRHFSETGTHEYRVVDDDDFDRLVDQAISAQALDRLTARLVGPPMEASVD